VSKQRHEYLNNQKFHDQPFVMPISITWFPASWLLIKTKDRVIYIDPAWVQKNFDKYPKKIIFSHYPEPMDGLPEADLPKADIVLITHHHQDHIKTATLNRLVKKDTRIFAPPKCAELIGRPFEEINPNDERMVGEMKIRAVYAYNTPSGSSTHKVHHRGECVGYLLTIDGKTIYHAGDTDVIPEMKELGKVDVAFLPISGTFTMNIQEATQATAIIKPKVVVPMHFLKANPETFKKETNNAVVLKIGQSFLLS
jgi:L-ascorbate metabolism protein UlaG (beta-lactamase superfamily)